MTPDFFTHRAEEVMTPDPQTIAAGILAAEAVRIMNDREITVLIVTENRKPVGAIHLHDCLHAGVA